VGWAETGEYLQGFENLAKKEWCLLARLVVGIVRLSTQPCLVNPQFRMPINLLSSWLRGRHFYTFYSMERDPVVSPGLFPP
jgi:hypothetical protein